MVYEFLKAVSSDCSTTEANTSCVLLAGTILDFSTCALEDVG